MKSPLLTCLKRPATIWGVLMVLGMCNGLFQLTAGVVYNVDLLTPELGTHSLSDGSKRSLFGLAAMLGLGMILSGVIQELWTVTALRHVAGLRSRLRFEFALVVCAAMALVTTICLVDAANQSISLNNTAVWPLLPVGLILGLTIFEPRWIGSGTIACILALFACCLGVEWMPVWLNAAPAGVSWGLLVVTLGAAVLLLTLLSGVDNQSRTLTKQLDGRLNTHRNPLDIQPWERRLRTGTLADARWKSGRIQTLSEHVRALDFERWGWTRKGWPFGPFGTTGYVLLMVLLNALWVAHLPSEAAVGYLATVSEMLGRPNLDNHATLNPTWLMANLLPGFVGAALLIINDRKLPGFRVGHVYPLSRAQRAAILVRGSRAAWTQTFVRLTLATGILWLVATALSSATFTSAPPLFLVTMVAAAASLPLLQFTAALRELRGNHTPNPVVSVSWITLMFSLGFAVLFGIVVLVLKLDTQMGWLTLALTALAIPVGQGLFQRYIERRFRTLELA